MNVYKECIVCVCVCVYKGRRGNIYLCGPEAISAVQRASRAATAAAAVYASAPAHTHTHAR